MVLDTAEDAAKAAAVLKKLPSPGNLLSRGRSPAATMQLEMGSTPASGVATRRPRRVVSPLAQPLNGESFREP